MLFALRGGGLGGMMVVPCVRGCPEAPVCSRIRHNSSRSWHLISQCTAPARIRCHSTIAPRQYQGLDLDTLVDVTWVGHVGSHAGGGAVGAVEDGRRVELLERGLVPKYRCRYVSTGCDNYCLRQDSYQHRSTALLVLVSAWSYSTMTVVDTPPLFNTRDWYKDTSRHIAD
eukprot:1189773-Rhodomonas_salina.2